MEGPALDTLDADPGSAPGAVGDAGTYFAVTPDGRKCASPLCGGWWLERLNQATTVCHDGSEADECYTPVFDWSEANLSDAQQARFLDAARRGGGRAIVRGRFAPTNTTTMPELGRFVIREAWIAEGDAVSSGEFVRVKDNGVRCFVAPCPSLTEDTLNRAQSGKIAGIDWTPAELSLPQITEYEQAMYTPDGVLVAGYHYQVRGIGGTALGRTATAAYHRLTPP